jgi:SNF2 family DNA or RNA helicase
VTVYRLLTAGTIEERIIAMHETKRAIADALLERTGAGEGDGDGGEEGRDSVIAGALDVDELIELMRG